MPIFRRRRSGSDAPVDTGRSTGPGEGDEVTEEMLLGAANWAHELVSTGQLAEADRVLRGLVGHAQALSPSSASFLVFRLLGQCARVAGRLDDARRAYVMAFEVAAAMPESNGERAVDLRVAAITGLATVEIADDRLEQAVKLFGMATQLAELVTDKTGLVSVLSGHAEVLHRQGKTGAEGLYRRALAQPGVAGPRRGILLDNMAREFFRQGRHDEAIEAAAEGVRLLADSPARYDAYKAMINLATIRREANRGSTGEAFTAAHDLIHDLHSEVDAAHYTTGFRARVERIEAATRERMGDDPLALAHPAFREMVAKLGDPRIRQDLTIGAPAYFAKRASEEGQRHLMEHRYGEAERSLRTAEDLWNQLGAAHALPAVWSSLGLLYAIVGRHDEALALLEQARRTAHEIGDARAEFTALINLCTLLSRDPARTGLNLLELAAQARALFTFLNGQFPVETTGDLGILDSIMAGVARDHGATALADRYLLASIETVQRAHDRHGAELPFAGLDRLALRLGTLVLDWTRSGRAEQAAPFRARLVALRGAATAAAVRYPADAALGLAALAAGERTEQTLRVLRDACDGYDELRQGIADLSGAAGYGAIFTPPFVEAADLAVELGRVEEAFALLERAKSRALLEAMRDRETGVDPADPLVAREAALWAELRRLRASGMDVDRSVDTEERRRLLVRRMSASEEQSRVRGELHDLWQQMAATHPTMRAHRMAEPITADEVAPLLADAGDAVLVEYLTGPFGVWAFTLSGTDLTARRLLGPHGPGAVAATDVDGWADLLASADDDRLRELVEHPVHAALTAPIADVPPSRPVYVVPHGTLHLVPLHVLPPARTADDAGGAAPSDIAEIRVRPRTYLLPSASLLRAHRSVPARTNPRGGEPDRRSAPAGRVLVCGDTLGDLPYARAECAYVAARLGGTERTGAAVTSAWLADALAGPERPRLVHLACHAVFDRRRPERSGLVLAAAPTPGAPRNLDEVVRGRHLDGDIRRGEPLDPRAAEPDSGADLVSLARLAQWNWSGVLVVLSACDSGRHEVRDGDELVGLGRTLLAAGASGLVTAIRPVPDLATALLMGWFYDGLDPADQLGLAQVGPVLGQAQRQLREASAADLVERGVHLVAAGGDQAVLGCRTIAVAHRTAGEMEAFVTWQRHLSRLAEGQPLPAGATSRHVSTGAPAYRTVRPFAGLADWVSFTVYGAAPVGS
ncbi:CHAT domain-containing protein [Verrucosispora sp. WMMC514]|uniref:CHAT domain-containing tetratricopeptide repeat protein n=1 Tax=Verrucosispora sp. WMMC514 TaxID=3015156 RepID=UPI00248C5EB7|nr:CHAT domain-containing protein [Verrucosispora sp. WMMC514]WBB91245.1 CHAT domain-containing protein [Verrucosispora sp. WMMC514]